MSLSIMVEPMIGDSLYNTLVDAWTLGAKLDVCIGFKFNDCSAFCYPDRRAHMHLPEGLDQFKMTEVGAALGVVVTRQYRGGERGEWTEWRRMER